MRDVVSDSVAEPCAYETDEFGVRLVLKSLIASDVALG
jgi:hypothetical protein